MLTIVCKDIAKRYTKEVLFKDFSFTFERSKKYAILGANSSGKSTLLKIIGGAISATKGEVIYSPSTPSHEIFSFCSPEMYLLDDFTVQELFELHFQFKTPKVPMGGFPLFLSFMGRSMTLTVAVLRVCVRID